MTFIQFLENYNGALMFLAAILSAITTVIIAFISYKNLKELKTTREEENRPYIVFFIDKLKHNAKDYYLVIKNYGKTGGKVQNINMSPELDYSKTKESTLKIKPLTKVKNLYLAPNQSVISDFDFTSYPDKVFNVTISYSDKKKTYKETSSIDLNYTDNVMWSSRTNTYDTDKELHAINENIQGLIGKLY